MLSVRCGACAFRRTSSQGSAIWQPSSVSTAGLQGRQAFEPVRSRMSLPYAIGSRYMEMSMLCPLVGGPGQLPQLLVGLCQSMCAYQWPSM
jgi:hypothetical protein